MSKQEVYEKAAAEYVASKKNREKNPEVYNKAKEKMRKARADLRGSRTDPGSNGMSGDEDNVIVSPSTIATSAGVNGPGQ